jgi:hypothetical protein
MSEDARKLFPIRCAGNRVVQWACFLVDAFPPHGRGLVMVVATAGSVLRPYVVTMAAGDDTYPRKWLAGAGGFTADQADAIIRAAREMESWYQTRAREIPPHE